MILSSVLMLAITVVCQWCPECFVQVFTRAPAVVAVGGMFQALGNTWPSLLSSASRLLTFVLAAVLWSRSPHFTLTQLWYLSVATVSLQAVSSLVLLLRELRRKLDAPPVGGDRRRRCGANRSGLGLGLSAGTPACPMRAWRAS